jgi:hypothetical protein
MLELNWIRKKILGRVIRLELDLNLPKLIIIRKAQKK